MCKCNPSIRTPVCEYCIHLTKKGSWQGERCPPKTIKNKIDTINLAMETDDLIFVDELLVRPQAIHNNELEYMNLVTLQYEFCDLNEVEVRKYDE